MIRATNSALRRTTGFRHSEGFGMVTTELASKHLSPEMRPHRVVDPSDADCQYCFQETVMPQVAPPRSQQSYRHEAFMWRDPDDYASVLGPFVEDGLAAGEAVMVAVVRRHASWLRESLGTQARKVKFVDMAKLGRNPARIIPAWQKFVDQHSGYGRPVRGIGEPIWAGRRPEEILECQLHEALLNVAVDPKIPLWLICPYDLRALDPSVIKEAHRSHPAVMDGDSYQGNSQYGGRAHVEAMFGSDLPELDGKPAEYTFTRESVDRVFNIVTLEAYGAGLWSDKVTELAATARRLASCSVRRGAMEGTIQMWDAPHALICEVSDNTMIDDVLAGRRALVSSDRDGLSSANRRCDLVQLRSTNSGTTVRLHMWK
jgi:MEDS: MEthanogen/methylotroph, DcmR Sensory domain